MTLQVNTGSFGPTMIWPIRDIRPEGVILLYNRGCDICWLRSVTIDTADESLTIGVRSRNKLKKAC